MTDEKFLDYEPGRLLVWEKDILHELRAKNRQAKEKEGWFLRCYEQVDSTMNVARSLLPTEDFDLNIETHSEENIRPTLVLARRQRAGRGRQGRKWMDSEESFCATYLFEAHCPVARLAGLSLVVGCVVNEILTAIGCDVGMKWPNDILARPQVGQPRGRKVGGILTEVVSLQQSQAVLIGIGINLRGEPTEIESTSIFSLSGRRISAPQLAMRLSNPLREAFQTFEQEGFKKFQERWMTHAFLINQEISVHVGERLIKGVFLGVTPNGAMRIERDGAIVEIATGEVL
jgi:BirA family biotin operon repressor/biotin-[acetyl-CoA-carboxylase] ligase